MLWASMKTTLVRRALSTLATFALVACSAPSGAPPAQTIARTCVYESGCGGGTLGLGQSVSACTNVLQRALATNALAQLGVPTSLVARIAGCGTASSCAAFSDCVSLNHGATYCAAHSGQSCDGSVLVTCGTGTTQAVDCAAFGLSCASASGHSTCSNGTACDPMTAPSCDGSRMVRCDSDTHLQSTLDCGQVASGWTCSIGNSGPLCVPPTPTCTAGAVRCDGDVLVSCPNDLLHEIRLDCAATYSGAHCGTVGGQFDCIQAAAACSATTLDTCMGNSLQTCLNGSIQTIDCTALGFQRCATTTTPQGVRSGCSN